MSRRQSMFSLRDERTRNPQAGICNSFSQLAQQWFDPGEDVAGTPSSFTRTSLTPLHLRSTTSRAHRMKEIERRTREVSGCTLDGLRILDLQCNPELRTELSQLQLNECFDERGMLRFRQLGVALTARREPPVQEVIRQKNAPDLREEGAHKLSAKAYLLAAEAREKDVEYRKRKVQELRDMISDSEKHRVEDVHQRQLEMFFKELPDFSEHLPLGVDPRNLLPTYLDGEDELRDRHDRASTHFLDKRWIVGSRMNWMFLREEVIVLVQQASLWTHAARGYCSMGMDRSSFCRFILDLGVADQTLVLYHWAVTQFDNAAQFKRCSLHASSVLSAPIVRVVNWWHLVSVFDVILKKCLETRHKKMFFRNLLKVARMKLPEHAVEESGLKDETLEAYLSGEEVPGFCCEPVAPPGGCDGNESETPTGNAQLPKWLRADVFVSSAGPGSGTPHPNTHIEDIMRNQLINSMLVEPEILHVAVQYCELFRMFHGCYADTQGHMSFSQFLQFCVDFRLSPQCVSSYHLQRAYEEARSLEMLLPKSRLGVGNLLWKQVFFEATTESSERPRTVEAKFGVGAFMETLCRAAFIYLGFYGNSLQQNTGAYAQFTWLVTYLRYVFVSLSQSFERRSTTPQLGIDGPLLRTLQTISVVHWGTPPEFKVRPDGVTFHTTDKANTIEEGFSVKPSVVNVGSEKCKMDMLPRGTPHNRSRRNSIPNPTTTSAPYGTAQAPCNRFRAKRKTVHIPKTLERTGALTINAASSPQKGPEMPNSCSMKGTCPTCAWHVDKGSLGNPMCHACSVVDRMPFSLHPFAPLILGVPPAIIPKTSSVNQPVNVNHSPLTPPATTTLNAVCLRS